jgi:hypothetical protein
MSDNSTMSICEVSFLYAETRMRSVFLVLIFIVEVSNVKVWNLM